MIMMNPNERDEELHEALRILESAEEPNFVEEEPNAMTRSQTDENRFRLEQEDAYHYAEYVVIGWREPEPQDFGKRPYLIEASVAPKLI